MSEFRPSAILDILTDHGVEFVVIGGYAARLHGASRPTFDVDVTPERSHDNLERLATALTALSARIRVDGIDEGLPFSTDATALAGMAMLNLTTPHGDLDISMTPAGTSDSTTSSATHVRSAPARTTRASRASPT